VEHVDELIPAHALRALDPDDERAVTAHLDSCERCRMRLRDFEGVASAIAYASPSVDPPPELRDRLLTAIGAVVAPPEPAAAAAEAVAPRTERWSWWPRFSLVAVPALALVVLALAVWSVSLNNRLSDRTVSAATPIGDVGSAVAYRSGDVTLFTHLPAADSEHTYEAWVIRGANATPLPAGVFKGGGNTAFDLSRDAQPGDTIAITLEPGTGGLVPTGTMVGSGRLV